MHSLADPDHASWSRSAPVVAQVFARGSMVPEVEPRKAPPVHLPRLRLDADRRGKQAVSQGPEECSAIHPWEVTSGQGACGRRFLGLPAPLASR
jgi:hypothetical protein